MSTEHAAAIRRSAPPTRTEERPLARPQSRARVAHVITGLGMGGAERMLQRLLGMLDADRFECEVLSLTPGGRVGDEIRAGAVPVRAPARPGLAALAQTLAGTARAWRRRPPDLVQGWLAHGNLTASAMARAMPGGRPPVVWNVRQAIYALEYERASTARLLRLAARVSRSADRIIYNSSTAARHHAALGFAPELAAVVPNGFETDASCGDPRDRAAARHAWGVDDATLVVGIVARYHRHKDHPTFLRAIRTLVDRGMPVVGIAAGAGIDGQNAELAALVSSLGLATRVRLLGDRPDVARLYPGFDVACLSSITESFPNALGEAMAAGVPCVATNVGAAAELIADTGRVVPPGDPAALAGAIAELADAGPLARAELGRQARDRIESSFSLRAVARRYETLYAELLADVAER